MGEDEGQGRLARGQAEVGAEAAALRGAPGVTLASALVVIETAISHGVALFNEGDHVGCFTLYQLTAQRIIEAARRPEPGLDVARRPRTARLVEELERALRRAELYTTAGESAWAMRHAFDKASLDYRITAEHLHGLIKLGELAVRRGDFGGGAEALQDACGLAEDLLLGASQHSGGLQAPHVVFLFHGHALLGSGRYEEAARALRRGLELVPQWPTMGVDLEELSETCRAFGDQIDALEDHLEARPDDEDARLVFSYALFFSGRQPEALPHLRALLQRDPADAIAAHLLAHAQGAVGVA